MKTANKIPAAAATAGRGDGLIFGDQPHSNETTLSGQVFDSVTVTIRRHIEAELPVWVRIQRLDGTVIKLRPGPLTSPKEFAKLVEVAKAVLRKGAP